MNCQVTVTVLSAKLLTQGSPSLVFLAGGVPNPGMFPFENMSVSVKGGTTINLEKKDMTAALQYGPTQGYFIHSVISPSAFKNFL